ncbi:MAG: YidC/Oxa1 family membrane protein insertase [Oscillospiraceae bacterium]|nr:YidC/Oxa1 family membrane protein insertase [Oscillospiraceae bacterium]
MNFISNILGYPLGLVMWLIYKLVKNYGIAILLFTFLVRLIMFPLSVKQQKSSAVMAAFSPKLEEIKKKYANNPNKQQEEQMKLYEEEGVNPMASCLPMLIQLVFLYGVFDVIYRPLHHIARLSNDTINSIKEIAAPLFEGNNYFNSRPELFILQSVQNDPAYYLDNGVSAEIVNSITSFNNKLFGIVDLGTIPNTIFQNNISTWTAESWGLLLIPIIAGLLQLATTIYSVRKQKKLNPTGDQAAQSMMGGMNTMLYLMPLMSVWISFSTAAGLGYYWICSSLVGLIQMVVLNKVYTPEYVAKLVEKDKAKKKNKKRSAISEKYHEMMQQALEMQAEQNGQDSKAVSRASVKDEDGNEVKLSRSQMNEYEKQIIAEARRRQEEKYGERTADIEDDAPKGKKGKKNTPVQQPEEDPAIVEARRRMAEKYGDRIN